jgi:branched-chain amino acid transport system substrate-binding protein
MRKTITALAALAAVFGIGATAKAGDPVKIGMIMAYSGQFADPSAQMDNGVKLYMQQHGDTVAGRKIEVIRKDSGGINPPLVKRLAQELIVRDKVDLLAGFTTSPNGFAAADVSKQAKKFMVIMLAATSAIITHSDYLVRASFTIPQQVGTTGTWAAKSGIKRAYLMVTDYAPGKDAETAFSEAFKAGGGEVVGSVRMPVANPDFSAYVQRAKDLDPESIFVFIPGGTQPAALAKALAERGVDTKKVKILTTGEMVDEQPLKSMGDAALGIISGWHYDISHDSKMNKEFVKAYVDAFHRDPDFFALGGYDGMHAIYEALKKTGGDTDAAKLTAAAKGMSWESPRGPMSLDPVTGDVVQTVYIRRVEKVGGKLDNVEIAKFPAVKDPLSISPKK